MKTTQSQTGAYPVLTIILYLSHRSCCVGHPVGKEENIGALPLVGIHGCG